MQAFSLEAGSPSLGMLSQLQLKLKPHLWGLSLELGHDARVHLHQMEGTSHAASFSGVSPLANGGAGAESAGGSTPQGTFSSGTGWRAHPGREHEEGERGLSLSRVTLLKRLFCCFFGAGFEAEGLLEHQSNSARTWHCEFRRLLGQP